MIFWGTELEIMCVCVWALFELNSACSEITEIPPMVTPPFFKPSVCFWGFWSSQVWSADTWAVHALTSFIQAKLHDAHSSGPGLWTLQTVWGNARRGRYESCVWDLNDAQCERWPVLIRSPSGRALTSKEMDNFRHRRCLMWPYFQETVHLCILGSEN